MQLARVLGTVVATVKTESLEGRKLLVIQPLDARMLRKASRWSQSIPWARALEKLFSGAGDARLRFRFCLLKYRLIAR